MLNHDSHIYLYAKGHYQKTDTIEDLKVILGHRSGTPADCISRKDIMDVLCKIVWEHLYNNSTFDNPTMFQKVIERINPTFDILPYPKQASTLERTIKALLSILLNLKVRDDKGNTLIELDRADYTILPCNR